MAINRRMRNIGNGRGRREQRQKEAQERNAAYRILSVPERKKLVEHRQTYLGGGSRRELARLENLVVNVK